MNDHCISRRSFLVAAGMAGAAAALTACGGAASSAGSSVASSAAVSPEAAQTVEFIKKTAMTRIVTMILYLRFISHLLFFIGYFMQTCPHYMSLFLPVPVSRSAVISLIPYLAQRSVFF